MCCCQYKEEDEMTVCVVVALATHLHMWDKFMLQVSWMVKLQIGIRGNWHKKTEVDGHNVLVEMLIQYNKMLWEVCYRDCKVCESMCYGMSVVTLVAWIAEIISQMILEMTWMKMRWFGSRPYMHALLWANQFGSWHDGDEFWHCGHVRSCHK